MPDPGADFQFVSLAVTTVKYRHMPPYAAIRPNGGIWQLRGARLSPRLTAASSRSVASQFDDDAGNRMTRPIDEIAGLRFETGFTDDGNDNLTNLRYPSGNRVSSRYDSNNRLVSADETEGVWSSRGTSSVSIK